MPAVFKSSPEGLFPTPNPANLLVLTSVTMKDRVFGSTAATRSGIGKMFVPWKYGAYLPTLFFSCSSALLLLIDLETGIAGLLLMVNVSCLGWMELAGSDEISSAGHSAGIGVWATGDFVSLGRAFRSLVFENRSKDELMLLSFSLVAWHNQDEYVLCW